MEREPAESLRNPDENEDGVNVARLRENLKLTVEERLARHDRALDSVLALREAGEKARRRKNRKCAP